MAATLRVALAQLNLLVGYIEGNARRIVEAAEAARTQHSAHIIVFPNSVRLSTRGFAFSPKFGAAGLPSYGYRFRSSWY